MNPFVFFKVCFVVVLLIVCSVVSNRCPPVSVVRLFLEKALGNKQGHLKWKSLQIANKIALVIKISSN